MAVGPVGITLAVLLLVFAPLVIAPTDGLFWDMGAAIGFLALGGLILQTLPCRRPRDQLRHTRLAPWLLGICFAHAMWYLIGDPTMRFSLLTWSGPLHLWLAVIALALFASLSVLARIPDRFRTHRGYAAFRINHRNAALFVLLLSALHIGLSGFYATGPGLVPLALVSLAMIRVIRRQGMSLPAASVRAYLVGGLAIMALIAMARWD